MYEPVGRVHSIDKISLINKTKRPGVEFRSRNVAISLSEDNRLNNSYSVLAQLYQ